MPFAKIQNSYINDNIKELLLNFDYTKCKSILICDIDSFDTSINSIINNNTSVDFYYTIKKESDKKKYQELYKSGNCHFIDKNIYMDRFTNLKFDYICAVPVFGWRLIDVSDGYISKDSSMFACQNLLYHLNVDGHLRIVLPAKITFGSGEPERFRQYIETNYKINEIYSLLPGTFRPLTDIKTFLFDFSIGETNEIIIYKVEKEIVDNKEKKYAFKNVVDKLIFKDEFENIKSWNIDKLFAEYDEEMDEYNNSNCPKIQIKDIAYLFKGKTVINKNPDGNIRIINISNIENNEINYKNLERFEDDVMKNAKYILNDGDVLITARGTTIKVAVFEKQNYTCIASSNLNVIRVKDRINSYYLKLFLESRVGTELLKSLQRGNKLININYQDLGMIEVPILDVKDQNVIINEYNNELDKYKIACNNWKFAQKKIYSSLF